MYSYFVHDIILKREIELNELTKAAQHALAPDAAPLRSAKRLNPSVRQLERYGCEQANRVCCPDCAGGAHQDLRRDYHIYGYS